MSDSGTKKAGNTGSFVGFEGFEPTTPALSRRCSKPTELKSRNGGAKIENLFNEEVNLLPHNFLLLTLRFNLII